MFSPLFLNFAEGRVQPIPDIPAFCNLDTSYKNERGQRTHVFCVQQPRSNFYLQGTSQTVTRRFALRLAASRRDTHPCLTLYLLLLYRLSLDRIDGANGDQQEDRRQCQLDDDAYDHPVIHDEILRMRAEPAA